MPADSFDFRDALRHFPSGVTLVTIKCGDVIHGLTVSAFASISPTPPLIMVAIDHKHTAFPLLQTPGAVFAVNILHEEQADLSNRFAWMPDDVRFDAGDWTTSVTGAPILTSAIAWLDCTIYASYAAGTHNIYVGQVMSSGVPRPDAPPLVYWNREYRRLALP
ncbi:MAG: flavin reductase family protein [Candidatus Promineifilaceae bacterium]